MNDTNSSPQIERLSGLVARLDEKRNKPLYLLVNDAFALIDAKGHAAHYGFDDLERGCDLSARLLFLVGMEGEGPETISLPMVDMENGVYAQVQAVRARNGWGLAFTDVTAQQQQQRQYQQLAHELALAQRELQKRQARLEELARMKSQFIGRMSHEFRTPLSSILGFVDLAREDLGDVGRLQHDLQAIKRGGTYLLSLVDNLLDHAVVENDELIIRPAASDLSSLVAELEEFFQPTAQQRGLSLAWWMDGRLPERLWLDELRLRQVLVNLIGNAVKYTEQGGITVSLDWEDGQLKVAVEDTGAGIPEADLKQLFEPFRQGSAGANARPGAGLGLTISRMIVRRMGGELELQSQPGRGTSAHFHIPAPARAGSLLNETSLAGRHCVLLEDDPDLRELLEVFLQGAGARLDIARDIEACEALVGHGQPVDLVLVELPEEPHDRLLLRRLRQAGFAGPVVAIGTQQDERQLRRLEQAGYAALLTKPLRRGELIQQLAEVVQSGS